jgi:hypothetical protein
MFGLILFALVGVPAGAPAFHVTINPEARVSVVGGVVPAAQSCGVPITLSVRVSNEGGVTAPLGVTLLSDGAVLSNVPSAPLSGSAADDRQVAVLLTLPPPVDVTLAFDAGSGTRDLGWRSTASLLLSCRDTH